MKKLLSKLGYIPKSAIEELNAKIVGLEAVNGMMLQRSESLERELRQVISERERHKLAHESLKEEHEQQQRVQSKLATALSGRVPILNKQT